MEASKPSSIGVIISTYNNPQWLQKVLWGFLCQTMLPNEIVIADDGSREPTRQLIEEFAKEAPFTVRHVWQEDDGFRKSLILNKAILASTSHYLIFTDQDCIPRHDFVHTHYKYAQKGYMLSGGYFKLPMDISESITQSDITTGRAFSFKWLRNKGLGINFKCTKLVDDENFTTIMNHITTTRASWNGCNSSGWRDDMLAINGYNEQMQYGGQDREFGERLANMGVKSKQIRYSAICLHLDHNRPYKTSESITKNIEIRRSTRQSKIVQTPYGINKLSN